MKFTLIWSILGINFVEMFFKRNFYVLIRRFWVLWNCICKSMSIDPNREMKKKSSDRKRDSISLFRCLWLPMILQLISLGIYFERFNIFVRIVDIEINTQFLFFSYFLVFYFTLHSIFRLDHFIGLWLRFISKYFLDLLFLSIPDMH